MASTIAKSVSELLNEEKWTRAALNSYTTHNFQELDKTIQDITGVESETEVRTLCDEHLSHTRNSIIGLYVSGVLALRKRVLDDTNLIRLTTIFADNHKWNVVEYLCNRVLEFGESKYALRMLAECYEKENKEQKRFEVWERLIRVDYEEADIVKRLAENRESAGDVDGAIDYYKRAVHRYINRRMFSNVKEVWDKLTDLAPDDKDFFFLIERKVLQGLGAERAASLLHTLYPYYQRKPDYDTAIEILKRLLTYEPKNHQARKDIVECYKSKFAGHSHLEEYIRISNLTQSWRNVHDAIADFEKHIAFDAGNFVHHRSWGIGRIVEVKDDDVVIDFVGKKQHSMSLKMAVSALGALGKEHIWVLRSTIKKSDLKERVKTDVPWALRTVIRSFGNAAGMKKIKEELVPAILTASEWNRWNTEARKVLKREAEFGNVPEDPDRYTVRDTPMSFEEKTANRFRAERDFFARVQTIREFLENATPDSEYFAEMLSYFTGILSSATTVTEEVVASHLLISRIVSQFPFLNPGLELNFKSTFERIQDISGLFTKLESLDLRKELMVSIRREVDEWAASFRKLFPLHPDKYLVEELVRSERWSDLEALIAEALARYRDDREAFVWLVRNAFEEPWAARFVVPRERVLINLIYLLDITFREIESKREVAANRKLIRQIQEYLFDEGKLLAHLMTADKESITRLYTLVSDVRELDPSIKIGLRHRIVARFPDFRFLGGEEKEVVSMGQLASRRSFEDKQRALRTLVEVDIPQVAKEISVAMAKGDLRENAEFKAAKEKQGLLQSTATRMKEELEKARIFDETKIDTSVVSFGTIAILKNLSTSATERYTILGPWESNPTENVISYLSPFGMELCNHRPGEELRFKINQKEFGYMLKEVLPYDFSGGGKA
jgi:transcription elongation factor GreA-like protein/transcription elongation GreA/GreB family factor